MKLYDAHIHWQDERLAPCMTADFKECQNLGIMNWICAGTTSDDWKKIQKLSELIKGLIPAYGLHPWFIQEGADSWREEIKNYLSNPSALVGEIGLDAQVEVPWQKQVDAFLFQWNLALTYERPVIVHCRKAYEELRELIKKEGVPTKGFLLHSYGGSREQIDEFVRLGAYFSVSGNITSPTNKKAKLNAVAFPLDRLLIETDAPFMTPYIDGVKWEGINRPQNLVSVFKELAYLKKMEESKLSSQLEMNFKKFLSSILESSESHSG